MRPMLALIEPGKARAEKGGPFDVTSWGLLQEALQRC